MTILILDVRPPHPADIVHLGTVLPNVAAFTISFVVLGVLWFGHRVEFEYIHQADHGLVWLNLLMLFLVCLVPFSAAFIASDLGSRAAAVVYGANLALASIVHGLVWLYATGKARLISPEIPHTFVSRSRRVTLLPSVGYVLGAFVAFLSPQAALFVYVSGSKIA